MKYIVAKAGSYCQSWRIVVVVVRTSCSSNSSSSLVVGLMVAVVVAEVIVVGLLAAQTICHMKGMVLIDICRNNYNNPTSLF